MQPTLEIKKWFEALAGDWDTSENRERTQFFPIGCECKGRSHIRLGPGGAVLVIEGHSDGTAGGIGTQAFTASSPVSKIR